MPSNGKKYQGEPLHPCNCINLVMVPRGDWRLNSKDSARGSEMNVDTDEFLNELQTLLSKSDGKKVLKKASEKSK